MTRDINENTSIKVNWQGEIVSIQPRTRIWRYLTHNVFGQIWRMDKAEW